jgi:hypothetical protein
MINDAARKMFGFDITTPCEDITQNVDGTIGIVPKNAQSIDSTCLDHLWLNAGYQQETGYSDPSKQIKATYTNIRDRFSGLKKNEGTAAQKIQHPFTLCQRAGSAAPIQPNGQINEEAVANAKSMGSITNIQNYYNAIYNRANNPSNNPDEQSLAVKQCYGLNKVPKPIPPPPPPPPPPPSISYTKSPGMEIARGTEAIGFYMDGRSADSCKKECDTNPACGGYQEVFPVAGWSGCITLRSTSGSSPHPIPGATDLYTKNSSPTNTYNFYQGVDSGGNDIGNSSPNTIPALQQVCNENIRCKGFNTNGWVKHTIKPQSLWSKHGGSDPTKGMYVKNNA